MRKCKMYYYFLFSILITMLRFAPSVPRPNHRLVTRLIGWFVGLYGSLVLAESLIDELILRHQTHRGVADFDIRLLVGLALLYMCVLLLRRKHNAWRLAVIVCLFMLGLDVQSFTNSLDFDHISVAWLVRSMLTALVLGSLWLTRREFSVQSDVPTFRNSLHITSLVLLAVFAYGTVGFMALDRTDFQQEISLPAAMLHTVDRFAWVSTTPQSYSRRARLFTESLSFISAAAVAYAAVSFFQPVRSRYRSQDRERQQLADLLARHRAPSEDFFKLWPHDKQYFLTDDKNAGLAYHVFRGVALVQGDPVGSTSGVARLLDSFDTICQQNDWVAAYIHVTNALRPTYESRGYRLQCIGQEAVVNIATFTSATTKNKHFRNIGNRFTKAGYQLELLTPPHSAATMAELQTISNDWLTRPGRSERGFVMGSFTESYMQQCQVAVVRDAAGQAQAFCNLVPAAFDADEATYDLLRNRAAAPANVNDFLLQQLILQLQAEGYQRFNLGLSPLVGVHKDQADSLVDTVLAFAYTNGDRFYSFSGLHRFKNKFEPVWSDRFIAYRGTAGSFSRVLRALLQVMKRTA